jgi:hypothetical protein
VSDIFHQQRGLYACNLHEKGGKFHEMTCHHMKGDLVEYKERVQLAEAGRVPFFQAIKYRPYGRGEVGAR